MNFCIQSLAKEKFYIGFFPLAAKKIQNRPEIYILQMADSEQLWVCTYYPPYDLDTMNEYETAVVISTGIHQTEVLYENFVKRLTTEVRKCLCVVFWQHHIRSFFQHRVVTFVQQHTIFVIKPVAPEKFLSPPSTKMVTIFVRRGDKNFSGASDFKIYSTKALFAPNFENDAIHIRVMLSYT